MLYNALIHHFAIVYQELLSTEVVLLVVRGWSQGLTSAGEHEFGILSVEG